MSHHLSMSRNTRQEQEHTRRASHRLASLRSVCMIESKNYPIVDWSMDGVQIVADPRMFSQNQKLEIILKFKLHHSILEIPCKGIIVRKANDRLGVKFESFDKNIRQLFLKVVDDYFANEFAESQTIKNKAIKK